MKRHCPFSELYEILGRLGRGSFGEVNKVSRKADGKVLVCKVMSYGSLSEKEKQLIVSEVNILRDLRHPHIVRYHDRVIDKKAAKIYVVMEYCEGGDLGKQIKKRRAEKRRFEESKIWRALAQLLLAFDECHNHREAGKMKPILHRDVKPGNVLLDSAGNIKLGDFGLAKELPSESRFAQTWVGTPYYMSPEMINEKRYNEKCDIWSIGCLVYEMAALRPPFDGKNVVSLGQKIVKGEFPPIHSTYSGELQQVIESMLSVDSTKRPSVGQLMNHPRLCKYVAEGKLLVKEYQFNQRVTQKLRELRFKEEELKKRERALACKEQMLVQRENELESKARRYSFEKRVQQVQNGAPVLGQKRVGLSKALGSKINTIDYLLHQEDHKRRLSAESSGSSTSCSTYSSSSSSANSTREKPFLTGAQKLPYLYNSPLADIENSSRAANRLRPRTLYGR